MSNELAQRPKHPLPKLEDIYADKEIAVQINDLNKLLNAKPKKEWIRQHPMAKKKIMVNGQMEEVATDYLPIERVEYLLTTIYLKWRKEIKQVQTIANSIVVTMRLWVLDPITGEWDWMEGVGAAPIRTKKGAAATDFSQVQDSAVQTGAPAAASYALKDAAEGFGVIFGANLNRKEDMDYQGMQAAKFKDAPSGIPEELAAVIEHADTPGLNNIIKANPEFHDVPEFKAAIVNRREALKKPA